MRCRPTSSFAMCPAPAFINVFESNWDLTLSNMMQMLDTLGPDYVPVTPSQLNTLYLEAEKP